MPNLNNDVSPERARALHRVVRAMHDGNCPKCGHLGPSASFYISAIETIDHPSYSCEAAHECPKCEFMITESEATAALELFRPYMESNLAEFEKWREERTVTK